ncbi:glycosyltransferase [Cellulophaga sp. E16_2]|uniref:glycosyltransferase n=1 Tax=Cellulophaga sp. E16_2 TaxID=2789297 RepID=UPI001A920F33|nr:glycosyltransferase [Cellulophaga sp. E16_2]MBO0593737.1 glycosyltransferase [Cellulophaga sp. E16_2]
MQKVLFIGVNWPELTTAAGTRIMQLLQVFLQKDYQVTFASTASESQFTLNLKSLNISKAKIELNSATFDLFISDLQPDVVLFDRFIIEEQFGWRVAEQVPNAVRILDTEDLHSLRTIRHELFKKDRPFSTSLWLQSDMAKRELASIFRCDISLIISSFEMQLLQDEARIDPALLRYVPFMVVAPTDKEIAQYPSFENRKDFICIGNGKHAPNIDAVLWLKTSIWPLIRQCLPESKVHIYGSYLSQQVLEMHKPTEGFYVQGFTEHLEDTFTHARLNLAPLRFGAGIKGKLLDSMRFGTPSVTTPIGAEGMANKLPWNGEISRDETDFATKAVALYTDERKWQEAQLNGFAILTRNYDAASLSNQFMETLVVLQNNLQLHRERNVVGSLLQHQSMQGTKYMSKWIELKNS